MQTELGPGFTLLALDASDAAVAAFEGAAKAEGVPLNVVRDTAADDRRAYEAKLILVRPDQYVVWMGDDAPGDEQRVVRRVVGAS